MSVTDRAALRRLMEGYAAAELRVRQSTIERQEAMAAVVDWVTAYAERIAAEVHTDEVGPIKDVSGGN
jgi:hypothetical protein